MVNLITKRNTLPKSNLGIQENEPLKELASWDDLVISKAGKGGPSVI